ncbi:hypothetical protein V8E52_011730 [Russula decolorans]|jgi:hypothetical protein
MGSQLSVKINSHAASITKNVSNSSAKTRVPHQISPSYSSTAFAPPPFPSPPGRSTSLDRLFKLLTKRGRRRAQIRRMSFIARHLAMTTDRRDVGQVIRIDVLPDDVLLEIFDFYIRDKPAIEAWQSLVHVCQRWRTLVFQSPRHLNLQLYCTPKTPARDTLDFWPALPLIIKGTMAQSPDTDNIVAALGPSNRVCQVDLWDLAGLKLEEVLAPMQVPFPELTDLRLWSNDKTPLVIPDSFLGGSAPRLRHFELDGIPFPGLPKLLLSATHIVHLRLINIPHSGYISPEAMVALLCALSSLESLSLGFQSPQSRPDWESQRLPSPKRSILPTLDNFCFKGVTEYLEELATRIDTPHLDHLNITFFNQIDFDCPRLAQFINCTPALRACDEAHVRFNDYTASITLRNRTSSFDDFLINISCREPDWQLSSIEQVCNTSLHPLSMVEHLYIVHEYWQLVWKDDAIENTVWLQLLLPFTAVKNLHLSTEFAPDIAATLQELVGGRMTEVLPSLQNIFVEGFEPSGLFRENIGQFVAARQLSSHPIAISVRGRVSDRDTVLGQVGDRDSVWRRVLDSDAVRRRANDSDTVRAVIEFND